MIKLKSFLFLLLIPTSNTLAHELERNVSCYDCSAFEKQSQALTEAFKLRSPQSKINVIDLANASVMTFSYQEGFGDVFNPDSYSITHIPSNSSLQQAAQNASEFVSTQGLEWPRGRKGINNSADFINHAQKNSIIDEWVHGEHPFTWYSTNLLSFFLGAPFDILRGIPIRVKFEDGSKIYIKSFDWNTSTSFTVSYIEGSALDADGNEIPTNINDYARTFFLTEANVESWIKNANHHGVNIVRQYTRTGQAERPLQTRCTRVETGRLRCTIVPRNESSIEPE